MTKQEIVLDVTDSPQLDISSVSSGDTTDVGEVVDFLNGPPPPLVLVTTLIRKLRYFLWSQGNHKL